MENKNEIAIYKEEIKNLTADPKIFKNLLDITFNGLKPDLALQAMLEGRITGFTLQNFLQKDVYAIPFKNAYSLVTSIDYARKIGQKNGVCGVTAPVYTEKDNKISTCEITVKKKVGDIIGEFTALVYFDEYYKSNQYKNSLWDTKPRTMIAKVAEMHALRKACPEELAKAYIEEETEKERTIIFENEQQKEEKKVEDTKTWKQKAEECKTVDELAKVWVEIPASLKKEKVVIDFVNELKLKLTPNDETVIEAEVE